MWCVDHPSEHDHVLVLLETKGLGHVEKADSKNDLWIFALAILLSSTFVYNTVNDWDLEQMHYVKEVTKLMEVNSFLNDDDEDNSYLQEYIHHFFPDLVWVMHKFTEKFHLLICPISPDECLENVLKFRTGKDINESKANLSRECIRRVFIKRKCFQFVLPAKRKIQLSYSDYIQESEMVPAFKHQADNFCSYIFSNAKPKRFIDNIMINGNRLGKLLEIYVNAISSRSDLLLNNTMLALAQTENSAAVHKATNHYIEQMVLKVNYPMDTLQDLEKLHTDCEKEAISIFQKHSFRNDRNKFWKELMKILENQKNDFILRNEEESTKYCQTKLENLSQTLRKAISQGTFSVPGGYKLYKEEREKMINNYHQEPRKGIKAEDVLQRYLQSLTMTEASILQTDQALTDQEKALEAERVKREAAEKEKKRLEQQQMEMQQKMEAQQRNYEVNTNQLKKKMEEDRIQILRKQEMILHHKLKEQERLMNERFCEEAEKMKRQMEHLQTKIKEIENKGSSWWSTVLQTVGIVLMVLLPGTGKLIGLGMMALGKWTSK
ncbi:guanylate-binding protein 7-like isoform X2 [Macrotis lagotis]